MASLNPTALLESVLSLRSSTRKKVRPRGAAMISVDRYQSLGELFQDALVQFKSETALIEANRKREARRLTYAELRREVERVACFLEERVVGGGDRVAILMSNQSRWIIAAAAVFLRGGVVVPLDYKLKPAEQSALLEHAAPKLLVVEGSSLRELDTRAVPVLVSERKGRDLPAGGTEWESLPRENGRPTFVPRRRDDVATVVYSSGTGGTPKGCLLTHGNYLAQYRSLETLYPLRMGDRYFSILPTNHAIDFMCGFVGPLGGGATIVHQRSLRPEFINWTMKRYAVTHMAVVPLILEAFERRVEEKLDEQRPARRGLFESLSAVNERLTEKRPNHSLSRTLLKPVHDAFGGSLEVLFCGGAFVDAARAEYFYRLGIPVVIGYGLSEATTVCTVHDLKPFRADSVGRPLPGVELRIDQPDEKGVGEVLVRGDTVMKGYLNEPELTAETIVDGWLRTGDLGWIDASRHLHLVGRKKNMIVTAGGKNVYPEDVEAVFSDLPAEELVVVASGYVWGGELDDELLVAVVRTDDREAFLSAFIDKNRSLSDYKRVRGVLFVDDEFPRTASMKIQRLKLAEILKEQPFSNVERLSE
ncbi:MAG: AMP-binding protein [Myxococcota bacterium]